MANVAVVGSQWGDEGKGKIVDWLSERADVVVRFQGGHNAGHTLVVGGTTYKLSLLPSGVVRQGKLSIIGNGVVVDPWALAEEIAKLAKLGVAISRDNLRIAENATLILPLHGKLDSLREAAAGGGDRHTRRGIGPAYEDKVARRAIRVMEQICRASRPSSSASLLITTRSAGLRRARNLSDELCGQLAEIAPASPLIGLAAAPRQRRTESASCSRARKASCSTSTTAPIPSSPPRTRWRRRLRPSRAWARRAQLRARHHQGLYHARGRGAVPDRTERRDGRDPRRARGRVRHGDGAAAPLRLVRRLPGAPDAEGRRHQWYRVHQARRARWAAELKVCVGYRLDGLPLDHLPAAQDAQVRVVPIYETMEGWTQSTRGARSWAELPAQCIKYVRRLEELIGAPVALLSTSPKREDTILVHDPFVD